MKEIKSIIDKYDELRSSNIRMALATVVHVADSSYRRSGARMLITEDGNWIGGISGGCLEGDTLKKAQHAIHENKIVKVSYDTRENDPNQIGVGLGCNGLIEILISPITVDDDKAIEVLRKCLDRRTPTILITDLNTGLVYENHEIKSLAPTLEKEVISVKNNAKSIKIGHEYFIEFIAPSITLFIFGSNYDVIPLVSIADALGWKCHIVSNPSKVSKSLFKLTNSIIDQESISYEFDPYAAALLMSHDYKRDKTNLAALQGQSIDYIGILGPKNRTERMLKEFDAEEITINPQQIYSPMGLDTGATSPEEIAIAIIAEVRTHFSRRSGGHLRNRIGAIHD